MSLKIRFKTNGGHGALLKIGITFRSILRSRVLQQLVLVQSFKRERCQVIRTALRWRVDILLKKEVELTGSMDQLRLTARMVMNLDMQLAQEKVMKLVTKLIMQLAEGIVMKLVTKLIIQLQEGMVMQLNRPKKLFKVALGLVIGLLLLSRVSSWFSAESSTLQGCELGDGRTHFIYIGNPGTGKTTLLNNQLGEISLASGVVGAGGGMTRGLQCVEQKERKAILCDTPGLNDARIRREAAGNITKGLKKGGCFKVFFVVKLESGRVRPEDTMTMKLVLESAPIKENEYSIIINKVGKKEQKKIKENWAHLMDTLLLGMPIKTNSTHVIPSLDELADEDNATMTNPQIKLDFKSFWRSAPTVWMDERKVMDIMIQDYEKTIQVLTENLTRVERRAQNAEEQMGDMQNRIMELEKGRRTFMTWFSTSMTWWS